ncbi:hypothetical protein [Pacificibacter marinus]|uniref:Uncharacterized protein n=1 Tax=Pacificibacter marinus TaxID=658057 RepID=A0A1Y5TJ91_9RHOB|nr:hypothetical protein [Pacificibacter marinus]SEL23994.1 hypothetical protein SAMN04488032_1159 [Pacificibacter marinus]SLN65599.1 hypothetical protein PAM7971_03454 [Pacificibacter marinus]
MSRIQHTDFSLKGRTAPDGPYFIGNLIFGLDPLRIDHAQIIVGAPHNHPALRRALAFRTLKEARGETVNSKRLILSALTSVEGTA